MAQTRFHNYKRPIIALDENARITSLLPAGLYGGFDTLTEVAGNQVSISHTATGLKRTNLTGIETSPMGCIVTKQGVVVYEDEAILVNVDFNPDGVWRTDLLVQNHYFVDSEGGAPAVYAVIKAWDGSLSPNLVAIGKIYVAPLSGNHTATRYERVEAKVPGGQYAIKKDSENELPWFAKATNNFITPINSFNVMIKPGLFYIETTSGRPTSSTSAWLVMVMRRSPYLIQLAIATNSGRSYSRSSLDTGATWAPWQNLNNSDVAGVDFSPILAAIGTRNYTADHYVTDGQSLTSSIDSLDQNLWAVSNNTNAALSNITNILTMIGDLNYAGNNYVVDSTSATAAIGVLDIALKAISNALGDLNYAGNNYVVDSTSATAAIGVLDIALKAEATSRANADTTINNTLTPLGEGFNYNTAAGVNTGGGGGDTTILSIATITNTNIIIEAVLSSVWVSGSDGAGAGGFAKKIASFKNVTGTVTQIGTTTSVAVHTNTASAPLLKFTISGTNILCQVTTGSGEVYKCRIKALVNQV